jgi:DNA-binding SARP family transcriptional activator
VGVRFALLGPLVVVDDAGRQVDVVGARQRVLLAALLLRANAPVSLPALAEAVWDGAVSPGRAATLRSYVMRLRRTLGPTLGARVRMRDPGYLIRLDESELDVLRFEALCEQVGSAVYEHAWGTASESASQALALWRTTPLADVPSQVLCDAWLPRLEQLHVQALEWHAEAELQLGHHEQLVPELRDLIMRHPLREDLHGQLMLALARSGQRAAALQVYQDARRLLVDQLGIEPGERLQRLQQRILAGQLEPEPGHTRSAPRTTPVPQQLPAAVRHFAGRGEELKALSELAQSAQSCGAVVISAIGGTAGIGKTALALHWAHQNSHRFPDGQLYVNLRGFDPSGSPVDITSAVRGFLDALAVPPARVPGELDAQLALYRSCLAGTHTLIVLDNARDAEQVRPLLPAASSCLVLVTSRDQLGGLVALDGATPLTLDLLTDDEARELLTHRLGHERVSHEEHAVEELISLCSGLPLALNIAVARAALRPERSLTALVDELRDARRRLDILTIGGTTADMRAVFSWSYQTLDRDTARMFRLLGVHPGADISLPAAASLAAVSLDQARHALDVLTAAHLLAEHVPGRYVFHDLLRAYAVELAGSQDNDDQRRAALRRVLDHYLHTAHAASLLLYPARDDPVTLPAPEPGAVPEALTGNRMAQDWFEAERAVLLASVTCAAEMGLDTYAWQLPWALSTFLDQRGHWHDYIAVQNVAITAARQAGDLVAQARARRGLGMALGRIGRYQEAQTELLHTLQLYGRLDDRQGQAACLYRLAGVLKGQGHTREALDYAQQALALYEAIGNRLGQADTLNAVGWYRLLLGNHPEALDYCRQALGLQRQLGNPLGEAGAWDSLGYAHHLGGQSAEAVACYQRALDILVSLGEQYYQASTLANLGDAHRAVGATAAARAAWRRALAILDDLQHPDADDIRTKLAILDTESPVP